MSDAKPSIFPAYEALYIECLLRHTRSAWKSVDEINDWLRLVKEEDARILDFPKSELFARLQNIVQQVASVSRYFWPAPRQKNAIHAHRAIRLQQGLSVADSSPLANRDLRNGLEHFDEKLDLYLSSEMAGIFVPDYVDHVEPVNEVPTHIFKAFYTSPLVFVLLNQRQKWRCWRMSLFEYTLH